MDYYKTALEVDMKHDKSPVTKADIAANDFIVKSLLEIAPEVTVISEEVTENHNTPPIKEYFWLVDPLDGTKSFIRKSGDFTVNIALIHNSKPVFGVIYVPVHKELYYTDEQGKAWKVKGDEKKQIQVNHPDKNAGFNFVVSHSHNDPATEKFMRHYKVRERKAASSSYKFCFIAEGSADIYPRFGPTMEWDTAAGHAIVNAAGGVVTNLDGSEFKYGKPGFRNPGFVARVRNI